MTKVATCLWFESAGEEAARFYVELLPGSSIDHVARMGPDGPAMLVAFRLGGVPYQALNGAREGLRETVSISVTTQGQAETDRLWSALTADGGRESRCGWLVDRFGLSWQVIPDALPRLLGSSDRAGAGRAMQAMLGMNKIDVAALEAAFAGG